MANNKMLIDAAHREETRVVVVHGNRIEEFDFEAQDRRQLKGNIYLAKVTRVEPSLQAAFIDYGGNRHGFLAFSEIHPDYYQIPAADRQALLEAEEEAAAEALAEEEDREDEDEKQPGFDDDLNDNPDPDAEGEAVAREESAENSDTNIAADTGAETGTGNGTDIGTQTDPEAETEASAKKRPRRRTRRTSRVKKAKNAEEHSEENPENANTDDQADAVNTDSDDDSSNSKDGGKTMAAMMDIDSISEPAPGNDDDGDGEGDDNQSDLSADDSGKSAEKPKRKTRRTTRRKPAKTSPQSESEAEEVQEPAKAEKADSDSADKTDDKADGDDSTDEKPVKAKRATSRRRTSRKKAKAEDDTDFETVEETSADPDDSALEHAGDNKNNSETSEPKPRRKSRRKKATASEDDDDSQSNGEVVESVGSDEDDLEEIEVKRPRRQYKIQEVIKRRQVMLVQVVKEERGNKGAALTTYLSLAGRYSVLMPNTARGGGISRKITNPSDRKRLKEIAQSLDVPKGMGVILRTAGASRDKEDIKRDFEYLMRLWENVRNLTLESSAPYLVYEEGSLIKRSIRDLYNRDIGEIIVSGKNGYREAKDFMAMMMPNHTKNVKFYNGEQPLLSKYNIETQLDKMVSPQVTLKSGGYLIINQTEALVAVDVNSGRSTREHSIEATALQTNLEAAEEVARQLRLRDLAGLVVIDFIDMEEKRNNRAVERKMKECLKNDRARIQVGHISHFGLMEMSRQRMRASVLESTMAVCPACNGVGHVRSDSSHAIYILRAIEEHLIRHSRFDVSVKVIPSAGIYILNNKREAVSELENRFGVNISFESDLSLEGQEFNIEKGPQATRTPVVSKAVNPMVGDESGSTDISDDGSDNNGGNNGRKGKRKRSRGKGRNKERNQNASEETVNSNEDNSASQIDPSARNDANSDDQVGEAEEPVTKPKRTRRSKKAQQKELVEQADENQSADTQETEETALEQTEDSEFVKEIISSSGRRIGRPGRKVKKPSPPQTASSSESVSQTDKPKKGAPAKQVKRRTTRRVKVEKPEETEEVLVEETKPVTQTDKPVEQQASIEETNEPDKEKKAKKSRSLWGGFFS